MSPTDVLQASIANLLKVFEQFENMAERVGVFDRVFAKPNVRNGFALISRDRNDLASSIRCRRFRPFAGVCRFFYFNDTRPGRV